MEFYLDLCRSAGGKILEIGCGTGRILIPAAAAGCSVVGLDLSQNMLAVCRRKLQEQPEEIQTNTRLVQGDMTDFDLGETFSLVTIPFRPFQHLLTIDDQMACLKCIRRHLADDGRLAFDLFQVDAKKMYGPTFTKEESEDFPWVDLPDGRRLRRAHRIPAHHWSQQYNDVELIYYVSHPDGRTERFVHAFPMRYLFRYEVEHLLARCGFRIAELFGDFDRSPLIDSSPEMIYIARKCQKPHN
jgi:SAM-dependent methyltransferase